MTSKERLLKCISHQPTDRAPISAYELCGWDSAAWYNNSPSYNKLMSIIREYTDCIYMLEPKYIEKPDGNKAIEEWDENGSHYTRTRLISPLGELTGLQRRDTGVHTEWTLKHLLEDISDIDKYLAVPYEPCEIDMSHFFEEKAMLGEKGLMMISINDPICTAAEAFEMGTFLVHAMTEQEKIKYFLDALHERQMYDLRRILKHDVRDVIFRVCGPEYATPPYLSPDYFEQYVTCYLKTICSEIKAAGAIPRIHCHGKINRVIDQFAQTEAQAIDPIEPPPDGDMELSDVKRLYGSRFCLFGNLELKELEIRDRGRIDSLVKAAMTAAGEGGGFVLMPTATPINEPLSPNTEANFIQMIESGYKYGQY